MRQLFFFFFFFLLSKKNKKQTNKKKLKLLGLIRSSSMLFINPFMSSVPWKGHWQTVKTEHGVWSGPALFAFTTGISINNRSRVYLHQNFLKAVVHVIIIDQWNQTARLYVMQVTVIYSRASLVAVTLKCSVKRVICKIWTGTLAKKVITKTHLFKYTETFTTKK